MREEEGYIAAQEAFLEDKYVKIKTWGRNIDHLRIVIKGKEDTPYENGLFVFEIKFLIM